jgi:hypothetical protein
LIVRSNLHLSTLTTTLLLLSLSVACGDNFRLTGAQADAAVGDDDDANPGDAALPSIPTVTANAPLDNTTDFAVNGTISATFSEPMTASTLTTATFTVTSGAGAIAVPGAVIYGNSRVVFRPTLRLAANGTFTATITTGAQSAGGVPLAAKHTWVFMTGSTVAQVEPVDLGTAGNFVVLAKSGISTVPASAITGDLGVSPAAGGSITGFALTADPTNVFSTSTQVTGKVFAANFAVPTPSNLTTAVSDMELAFTDAAARAPDVTELGAGNLGGLTIAPGVYKFGTGVLIPTNLTLSGSSTDVWIFQIAQTLTMNTGTKILLAGGAQAKNIFWQASGQITLNGGAHLEGILVSQTSIVLKTGASIHGRLLAQTAVTLDASTITKP